MTEMVIHLSIFASFPGHFRLPRWCGGKESACNAGNAGDVGLIPGWGRSSREGMTTHSSILAYRFQGQRGLVGYRPWGSLRVGREWAHTHTHHLICQKTLEKSSFRSCRASKELLLYWSMNWVSLIVQVFAEGTEVTDGALRSHGEHVYYGDYPSLLLHAYHILDRVTAESVPTIVQQYSWHWVLALKPKTSWKYL